MMLNAMTPQSATEAYEEPVMVVTAPTRVPAMTPTKTPARKRCVLQHAFESLAWESFGRSKTLLLIALLATVAACGSYPTPTPTATPTPAATPLPEATLTPEAMKEGGSRQTS